MFLTLKSQLIDQTPNLSRNIEGLMEKIQSFLQNIPKEKLNLTVPTLIELKSILMDASHAKLQDNNDLIQLQKLASQSINETLADYKNNDCNSLNEFINKIYSTI